MIPRKGLPKFSGQSPPLYLNYSADEYYYYIEAKEVKERPDKYIDTE